MTKKRESDGFYFGFAFPSIVKAGFIWSGKKGSFFLSVRTMLLNSLPSVMAKKIALERLCRKIKRKITNKSIQFLVTFATYTSGDILYQSPEANLSELVQVYYKKNAPVLNSFVLCIFTGWAVQLCLRLVFPQKHTTQIPFNQWRTTGKESKLHSVPLVFSKRRFYG